MERPGRRNGWQRGWAVGGLVTIWRGGSEQLEVGDFRNEYLTENLRDVGSGVMLITDIGEEKDPALQR
ncbi:hypothetical protein M4D58_03265 [Brevibacillus borstelensis]|uniref:hypothetical protein n=1 Tax=Brevibacillus borstelensis TaxID=45462 RepID=UPI00203FE336|nr:hypothetical protein [Brevibacillus borstelensis]MCM3589648.1 hypothetical protein [Brevibacillus borstelensis]